MGVEHQHQLMLLLDTGKYCCAQNLNLGPTALQFSALTLDQAGKSSKVVKKICNVYDLDGVDDQHPHGKSDRKYVMVNGLKKN